jgi:hypothetical protein
MLVMALQRRFVRGTADDHDNVTFGEICICWRLPWGRHEDPYVEIDDLHNQHLS